MTSKPLIGIAAMSARRVSGLRHSGSAVSDSVVKAVTAAGGIPVLVSPFAPTDIWAVIDGVVIPGGNDVNPALYEQAPHETFVGADYEGQDQCDIGVLEVIMKRDLPALLICRGMQLWNVCERGTLVQHLDTHSAHVNTVHKVTVSENSLLSAALRQEMIPSVSSYHHQSIGKIAPSLRPVAWSQDGVVEALELEGRKIIAVQWHPEDRFETCKTDAALFEWLVKEAAGDKASVNSDM